ncbi:abortive infection family protein [Hyphomonas sp. BRH_c22]|uniref:abortive infection family protein n=1 Tax=Hyphomonas sp. BRH_c22 TaxID=1629710 RepID=UPI00262EEE96|nr:abortive infection family protein [Hyphomonas sp. BRH_c22]
MDEFLPESTLERLNMMEGILIDSATGGSDQNHVYEHLRREFMGDPQIKSRLPDFVRTYRNLSAFWPYIKNQAPTYAERRQIISAAFTAVVEYLEGAARSPMDDATSDSLKTFDADGVHEIWMKALDRRSSDPEGAITIARTLLETVLKRIAEEMPITYTDKDDLPKLYNNVSKELKLAPSEHSEDSIKRILGGATTIVHGLSTLRNRLSDSHGRGTKLPVRPSARHASLAVNTAGAIATFLVETYEVRKSETP